MSNTYLVPEQRIRAEAKRDGITHLSTGIAVLRAGKVLVVRRSPNDFLGGNYELPGGGVDAGETLEESVRRELIEETGLTLSRIIGMFAGFEYETPLKPKVRQLNFLVEAAGTVALSEEHDAAMWVDREAMAGLPTTPAMIICVHDALHAAEHA